MLPSALVCLGSSAEVVGWCFAGAGVEPGHSVTRRMGIPRGGGERSSNGLTGPGDPVVVLAAAKRHNPSIWIRVSIVSRATAVDLIPSELQKVKYIDLALTIDRHDRLLVGVL